MAGIDKIAIGFTIAIVAIGVGFAFVGDNIQSSPSASPVVATKTISPSEKPAVQTDPFADIAAKVKEEPKIMKETTQPKPAETKPAETKPAETKPAETKPAETKPAETKPAEPEKVEQPSSPQTVNVEIPTGTSVPGCEETDKCYLPSQVTIKVEDTVTWTNTDTAAHTVTGGSPAEGPSGVFDSSLILGGAQYSHQFQDPGSFDYFCMVHPWMVGNVQVS